jgi:hypothetical protein
MASGHPRLPGYVVLQRTIAALTEKARFGIELWIGDRTGVVLLEVTMPGDPKEARVHAANCIRLAETASSPTVPLPI